ncbi:hypothetical protein C0J52_14224, partial [Blattella germanica]
GINNFTSIANSFGKRNLDSKQKVEEFFKKFLTFGQNGDSQNTTASSKRSITIDAGLAILNDLRKAQLEAIYAKEKEAAQPFLQNASVTTPKIAKLVIAASLKASSCGQNYICLAIVAYNVYNQAVVLEPEVAQEIQEGWTLAQSLAADAKVVEQQILAPAFSNMEAIGEEIISCIEGKFDA